ncbi:MAG TPA: hypothetical protein VFG83_10500 [Kofleriaceae bacterium]|nr:hypothetical protein [Kofleriaceae bacterium]
MFARCALATAIALACASHGAMASPAEDSGPAGDKITEDGHRHKVGAGLRLGTGYRAVFPYNDEFCGELKDDGGPANPCIARAPARLDVALTYGVSERFEVLFDVQLGLERDFGANPRGEGPRVVAFAPGIGGRLATIGKVGFYSSLQLVIDVGDYEQANEADLAVQNLSRLQVDIDRFGIYGFFSETVGWKRWLRFGLFGGIGGEVRFP